MNCGASKNFQGGNNGGHMPHAYICFVAVGGIAMFISDRMAEEEGRDERQKPNRGLSISRIAK